MRVRFTACAWVVNSPATLAGTMQCETASMRARPRREGWPVPERSAGPGRTAGAYDEQGDSVPQSRRRPNRSRRPSAGSRQPTAPGGSTARQRAATGGRGRSRSAGGVGPAVTAGASSLRQAVERRGAAPLLYLRGLPRFAPAGGIVALAAAGVLLPAPFGAVALLIVAAFLAWLVYLSWPAIDSTARTLRTVVIAVLVLAAVARLLRG